MLKMSLEEVDMIPMLKLEGELVAENVGAFKGKVIGLAEKKAPIVVDMSKVEFIDSAGIGAVIDMTQQFLKTETPIRIFQMSPFVKRVLSYFMKKENTKLAEQCIAFSKNMEPAS